MAAIKNKLQEEMASVKREIRKRTVGYIVTALGLVAGLAWNDAIKSLIEYFFPQNQSGFQAKIAYASIITLVAVLVSVYLMRLFEEDDMKEKGKSKK